MSQTKKNEADQHFGIFKEKFFSEQALKAQKG
jgi:hypothetical protein